MKKQSEMNGTNFLNAQKNSQFKDMVRRLFKNKAAVAGLFFLIFLILMAIFADALFDYNTQCINQNIPERLQWPSAQHWFGTDEYGRDLLIRIVFGSRISLSIGFIAVLFGLIVGGALGAVAGFFGGKIDNIIMRLCDVFLAVPMMLMAIVIVAALGASIVNLVIALSISSVPTFAHRAKRGSDRARHGLCRGRTRHRRKDATHSGALHPAQLHGPNHRADDAPRCRDDLQYGGAQLPRPWREGTAAGMGRTAVQRTRIYPRFWIPGLHSRYLHHADDPGAEPARRWSA